MIENLRTRKQDELHGRMRPYGILSSSATGRIRHGPRQRQSGRRKSAPARKLDPKICWIMKGRESLAS